MSAKICPQCGREYAETEKFCTEDGATLRNTSGAEGLVNSVVADRYLVIKKLGEGGMGQVYLAEHVRMKRKCALKVMHPAMGQDPDAVQRFSREAANAAQIIHPNVAAVFDFGETSDRLIYLAMEFVEGDSLSALVTKHQALPAPRAAVIAAQAAEGLAAAHELGIVHRDLKPDNIMIARSRDGSDLVKVVDFGIAKAMGSGSDGQKVTRTGFVIGTPEYMSPEQLVGDPVDGRSDIYSLALVAFNMFTGTLPFPSRTSQEAMIARLTQTPKTLAEMRGDVPWPPQLQEVMDRALARDPNERYASAKEFGRDLAESMRNMPNLTAEQLGTQMQAAIQAARSAGASAVRATPTMAVAPKAVGGINTAPPAAMAAKTAVIGQAPAAPAAPAKSGGGSKIAIGAGVGVLALAGIAYMVMGGSKAPTSDTAAAQPAAAVQPADPATQQPAQTVAMADTQSAAPAIEAPAATAPQPDPRQPTPRTTPTAPATQPATQPRTQPTTPLTQPTRPGPQQGPVQQPPIQQPATTPTVTTQPAAQPATQPVTPVFDAAAATADVKATINGYIGAFATRRPESLRRYYPAVGGDWDEMLSDTRNVQDLRARLTSMGEPDFDGGGTTATVTFSMAIEMKQGGQKMSQPLKYLARLRKDGGSWKIADLDAR